MKASYTPPRKGTSSAERRIDRDSQRVQAELDSNHGGPGTLYSRRGV